jgi:hypothetical protein
MNPVSKIFLIALMAPFALAAQAAPEAIPPSIRRAEPAIEFPATTNASQLGASFMVGYRFTVKEPVILTSLGAVLKSSGIQPVFGGLPASLDVSLWDSSGNLLVAATVSGDDPARGHFNYHAVPGTALVRGVTYTIAALVPAGWSVLSDVPGLTPGSAVVYGAPVSVVSTTRAFPSGDAIARNGYFGAGFTFVNGSAPVAAAGHDSSFHLGVPVRLNGSESFSPADRPLAWEWKLVSVPEGSAAALHGVDSQSPSFTPDREGLYRVQLTVHDGRTRSVPSTVSIVVPSSAR